MGFFFVAFPGAACFIISHICVDHGYTANFILNAKLEASLQSDFTNHSACSNYSAGSPWLNVTS